MEAALAQKGNLQISSSMAQPVCVFSWTLEGQLTQ